MSYLHDKKVVVPADKTNNNIVFENTEGIIKKWTIQRKLFGILYKTSLIPPLFWKCLYQARKVSGHYYMRGVVYYRVIKIVKNE
jgi:hypothetical protein